MLVRCRIVDKGVGSLRSRGDFGDTGTSFRFQGQLGCLSCRLFGSLTSISESSFEVQNSFRVSRSFFP